MNRESLLAERQLLLEGKLDELSQLADARMVPVENKSELYQLASRNAALYRAASRGIEDGLASVSAALSTAQGRLTYGKDGSRRLMDIASNRIKLKK